MVINSINSSNDDQQYFQDIADFKKEYTQKFDQIIKNNNEMIQKIDNKINKLNEEFKQKNKERDEKINKLSKNFFARPDDKTQIIDINFQENINYIEKKYSYYQQKYEQNNKNQNDLRNLIDQMNNKKQDIENNHLNKKRQQIDKKYETKKQEGNINNIDLERLNNIIEIDKKTKKLDLKRRYDNIKNEFENNILNLENNNFRSLIESQKRINNNIIELEKLENIKKLDKKAITQQYYDENVKNIISNFKNNFLNYLNELEKFDQEILNLKKKTQEDISNLKIDEFNIEFNFNKQEFDNKKHLIKQTLYDDEIKKIEKKLNDSTNKEEQIKKEYDVNYNLKIEEIRKKYKQQMSKLENISVTDIKSLSQQITDNLHKLENKQSEKLTEFEHKYNKIIKYDQNQPISEPEPTKSKPEPKPEPKPESKPEPKPKPKPKSEPTKPKSEITKPKSEPKSEHKPEISKHDKPNDIKLSADEKIIKHLIREYQTMILKLKKKINIAINERDSCNFWSYMTLLLIIFILLGIYFWYYNQIGVQEIE